MDASAIRTDNLTRDFGALRALDGLTIDVPRGSIFGFLGPNGSGKTTTIRLLLGLIAPTAGGAEVLGCDVVRQSDAVRLSCGALLEHTGLYERMTAEDNLEYYGRIARMSDGDRKARIRELLEQAELWDRRREPVGRWSRGMKQKLALVRVLLHRPALVFLDEPTAGLDPVAAAAWRKELAGQVRRDGITVFLTTHNLTEAEKLCGRVAVIRKGRQLAVGTPDDLRRRADTGLANVATIVGRGIDETMVARLQKRTDVLSVTRGDGQIDIRLAGHAEVSPIVTMLVTSGAAIEEVRRPKVSLEDLFLDLIEEQQGAEVPSC